MRLRALNRHRRHVSPTSRERRSCFGTSPALDLVRGTAVGPDIAARALLRRQVLDRPDAAHESDFALLKGRLRVDGSTDRSRPGWGVERLGAAAYQDRGHDPEREEQDYC